MHNIIAGETDVLLFVIVEHKRSWDEDCPGCRARMKRGSEGSALKLLDAPVAQRGLHLKTYFAIPWTVLGRGRSSSFRSFQYGELYCIYGAIRHHALCYIWGMCLKTAQNSNLYKLEFFNDKHLFCVEL